MTCHTGLCWDELHTPDPASLIKSWHGKKGSLSAFTAAKLWDSATPAITLLSPLSVSCHRYQKQKWRGISNGKVFLQCAPSLDGFLSVCRCPALQQWTEHGERVCARAWARGPSHDSCLERGHSKRIQIRHSAIPEQIQSVWVSLASPAFCPCPQLRTRQSRRWPTVSLHTVLFLDPEQKGYMAEREQQQASLLVAPHLQTKTTRYGQERITSRDLFQSYSSFIH